MNTLYTGFKAADIVPAMLAEGAVFHTLDIYHRHAIEKVHHAKAVCSAHLPAGPWDRIVFRAGPKLMSGELTLDLLQEAVNLLGGPGALRRQAGAEPRLKLDFVGRERDRNDLLDKVVDRTDRTFRAEWPASVPEGPSLTFTSYPGCFCHRRLDEGGLALAEVVAKDMKNEEAGEKQGGCLNLLDMGCGCGLVGFLIKSVVPDVNLVAVDSHSRAVEAATENAAKFGYSAEIILSDNGTPARMDGTFDVFVGNPPYYSDYRIAEVFLDTAKRALRPGGVCYTVCKNAAGLEPVQKRYFPEVEIIKRRGYAVLKSHHVQS